MNTLDCTGNRYLVLPTVNDNKIKRRCYGCNNLFYVLCDHRHKLIFGMVLLVALAINKYYVPRRDVGDNLCANWNSVLV